MDNFFENFKPYSVDKLLYNANTIIKVLEPIFGTDNFSKNYDAINTNQIALSLDEIYRLIRDSDDNKERIVRLPYGTIPYYNYKMTKNDCFEALIYLELCRGIIRKINYTNGIKYQLLCQEYEHKYKVPVICADGNLKKILLISDTHIGSSSQNFKMLHSLYDYASKRGVNYCFHLGDLFEGSKDMNDAVLKQQLELFKNEYPKTDDFDTFCISGNHDITINNYITSNYNNANATEKYGNFDLRGISWFNPRFTMDLFDEASLDIDNYKIHLYHRLYVSIFLKDSFKYENGIVKNVTDFDKIKNEIDFEFDLLLSGHMHIPNITDMENPRFKYPHLYLGVPSTSSLNLSGMSEYKCVGYILNLIYSNNKVIGVNVEFLAVDNNYTVIKYDELTYLNSEKRNEITTIIGNQKIYRRIV